MLGADGKVAGPGERIVGDKISGIFRKLILGQKRDNSQNEGRTDDKQRDTADNFEKSMQTLKGDAGTKEKLSKILCYAKALLILHS
jgi:hypothetical protein